jgi:ADP-glucose pyrophosphorylase
LAFREFGLAIGLQAAKNMGVLDEYWASIDEINSYWLQNSDWTEHEDINRVMLATSLEPDGFLSISE